MTDRINNLTENIEELTLDTNNSSPFALEDDPEILELERIEKEKKLQEEAKKHLQSLKGNMEEIDYIPKVRVSHHISKAQKRRIREIRTHIIIAVSTMAISVTSTLGAVNFKEWLGETKALRPYKKSIDKILIDNYQVIDDGTGHKMPAYNHDGIASELNNIFAKSEMSGKISLAVLSRSFDDDEYNMHYILAYMKDEYTNNTRDLLSYVNSVGFATIDDFYNAMVEYNYDFVKNEGKGKSL